MSSISGFGSSAANNASLNELSAVGKSSSSTLSITTSSSSTTTISDSINLSPDYIQSVEGAMGEGPEPSNDGSMFSALNANILVSPDLGGVGSLIDTYTKSLPSSTVYYSSYTAPSAAFLADLANLKTAAASGDLAASESDLATAKVDAPEGVGDGSGTALSVGDAAGEASLTLEGTANMSRELAARGYTPKGAEAEGIALMLYGLSENATNTSSSSAETRLQQITYLATYALEHGGTSGASNASDPLFNIISTLQNSQSGNAIDQSLTNLVALYSGGGLSIQQGSTTTTTTTVETTTLIEYLNANQENASSSTASSSTATPSNSSEALLQQLKKFATQAEENAARSEASHANDVLSKIISALQDLQLGGVLDQSLTSLDAGSKGGTPVTFESSTSIVEATTVQYLNSSQTLNQGSPTPGLNVHV